MDLLDIALNGALGASPASDDRDAHDVASSVAARIAQGESIADACAAAVVAPDRYLLWTLDDEIVSAMHAKALKVRAALLADTSLTLARVLRDTRTGERPMPLGARGLGDLAKALETESRLTETAVATPTGRGAPQAVRITFDALPSHLLQLPTVAPSVDDSERASELTDDAPSDYVIVEGDALDD